MTAHGRHSHGVQSDEDMLSPEGWLAAAEVECPPTKRG